MIINTGLRTDIPGFFSEWFYKRIDEGFVYVRNIYFENQVYHYKLNPNLVDCIIFSTKNPKPMLSNINKLDKFNHFWFITITPYEKEIESNVPNVNEVIKSFKNLSEKIGKERVSWRYDPIFINEKYTVEKHIESFEKISNSLSNYTEEVIISFIDLYEKTKYNFPKIKEVKKDERLKLGEAFAKIGKKNNIKVKTCVEGRELDKFGIDSSGCMTKEVIEKVIKNNIKIPNNKSKNRNCECLLNDDIGMYNTCNHGCLYCYANTNKKLVKRNLKKHDVNSPLLIGNIKETDTIKLINQKTYLSNDKTQQTKLI